MGRKRNDKSHPEIVQNTEKHVEHVKPSFSKQTIICIGEYPIKSLLRESFVGTKDETQLILIDKSSKDVAEWGQSSLDPDSILGLDLNVDTHFWFQVLPYVTKGGTFIERLKNKPIDNLRGAVMVASLWDGVGSAMLPALISQFKEWNTNSVAFALLPSKMQPSDVHFNAFSSMGMCASKDFTSILLLSRDQLERYVGVNRNGSILKGNAFVNYLLELVLAKENFVQELSELSRAFNVKMFTVLSAIGASLGIYGSIENILNTALSRPFLKFDLSTASLLYVLLRMPIGLKDKLPQAKIELAIANWFKEKADLQSVRVSEPIYVEDFSDRIDLVMFVGGFDVTKMFISMVKKVNPIKSFAIKQGSMKENEWQAIVKSLVAAD
jgi:hypothetical protein